MAEAEDLVAARTLLKCSLQNSRALASALHTTGDRLEGINRMLSALEAAVRPVPKQKCTFSAVRDHVDRAIGPAAAVLRVYGAVRELEKSLASDLCSDVFGYIVLVKQLEEALKFLADNCGLAIQWLDGVLQFLEDNAVEYDPYICNVEKSLRILRVAEERARFNGGILFAALEKLEAEFEQLLAENCLPVDSAPLPLPVPVVKKLQAIAERLNANNRLQSCLQTYAEIRSLNARKSLQALDLEYLEKTLTETNDVQDLEGSIDQWCKHFEFAIKKVYQVEFDLSNDVFEKIKPGISKVCFAKIATQSGILSFLEFGKKVSECNKDPIKLLKLLDIFATLDNLRVDFNRLFRGEACAEIQIRTRELIKRVVNGACEIFMELPLEIELQRKTSPPPDGSVPKLVTFVTDYCNKLLGQHYRPILTQVLHIQHNWKKHKCHQEIITNQIYFITKEIGLNLDSWSKSYGDVGLSYLFMMNSHCHFCNIKGTEFGELMGDSWVRSHEQYKEYYMALFIRETWGRILLLLTQLEGQFVSADSSKKRLKAFNRAVEDAYRKQSNWVVCNEDLRLKICKIVVQAFVPAYRNYLENYQLLVEQKGSPRKYVKYSLGELENMLSCLFEGEVRNFSSNENTHLIGKIKNIVSDQFRLALLQVV